jgi:hypothetical protein
MHPDVSGLDALEGHCQRFAVRLAVEDEAVVLIYFCPFFSVLAYRDENPAIAFRAGVAAVPEEDFAQPNRLSQIDLPPGVFLVGGMEAPLAGFLAVHAPGRILFWPNHPTGGKLVRAFRIGLDHPERILASPIGLDLLGRQSGEGLFWGFRGVWLFRFPSQ